MLLRALAAVLLLVSVIAAAGCTSLEEVEALRDEVAAVQATASAELASVRGRLEALPPDSPFRGPIEDQIDALQTTLARAGDALVNIDAVLDKARTDQQGAIRDGAALVGGLFGPQGVAIGGVAGSVLAFLWGLVQRRNAASIVRSFDALGAKDPHFREAIRGNKDLLNTIQTRGAQSFVDRVQVATYAATGVAP